MLFDSGGVLIRPVGGRWNPRHDFEEVVLRHQPAILADLFPAAFEAGQRFLNSSASTPSRADYHRAVLAVLGVDAPADALLAELEAPPATPPVELYPDALSVLVQLHASGIPMAVVSDGWAGLDLVYRVLGIEKYFAGFVSSEELGCVKPDPRMYAAGSDLVGAEPGACVFADDDPELVRAAIRLGYHGVAVVRDGPLPESVPAVGTLDELAALLMPLLGEGRGHDG